MKQESFQSWYGVYDEKMTPNKPKEVRKLEELIEAE